MTSGESINSDIMAKGKGRGPPIPYFDKGVLSPIGLWSHIDNHLQNKARNTTTNPYANEELGFSTTFYEIMKDSEFHHELWQHGLLYDDPLDRSFRKCSFTVGSHPYPVILMLILWSDVCSLLGGPEQTFRG